MAFSESVSSELERLERLRTSGAISQSEFDTLKVSVLNQVAAPQFGDSLGIPAEARQELDRLDFDLHQLVGYGGVLSLVIGCFAPLVHMPFVGGVNYIFNGRGDGMIVLALSIVAAALTYLRKYRGVAFTTLAIAAVCTFTFVHFEILLADLHKSVDTGLRDNPFRGLADVMMSSVGLDWAWALLIIGIGLLLISSLVGIRSIHSSELTT